jgi:YfiH family protein
MKVESAALAALPGIRHAFFTREGGVSTGIYASLNGGVGSADDQMHVMENRRRMAETLGAQHLLTCYQIHSADVVVVDRSWAGESAARADGIVTKSRGIAVGASAADCAPLLFADAEAGVIAAAHAGWKGALGGIAEATLDKMETLGAARARVVAAIGPLIRQQSYEVGPEFVARFTADDPANERYFAPSSRESHARFDLGGYLRMRLERAGAGRIDDLGLDTYADEARFFSYRRTTHRKEPDYGRQIAAITLDSA